MPLLGLGVRGLKSLETVFVVETSSLHSNRPSTLLEAFASRWTRNSPPHTQPPTLPLASLYHQIPAQISSIFPISSKTKREV